MLFFFTLPNGSTPGCVTRPVRPPVLICNSMQKTHVSWCCSLSTGCCCSLSLNYCDSPLRASHTMACVVGKTSRSHFNTSAASRNAHFWWNSRTTHVVLSRTYGLTNSTRTSCTKTNDGTTGTISLAMLEFLHLNRAHTHTWYLSCMHILRFKAQRWMALPVGILHVHKTPAWQIATEI